jgi:hypothetical protein
MVVAAAARFNGKDMTCLKEVKAHLDEMIKHRDHLWKTGAHELIRAELEGVDIRSIATP